MNQLANDPAFPCNSDTDDKFGLTKREKFAESAMVALFNHSELLRNTSDMDIDEHNEYMAMRAVKMADALIAELEKAELEKEEEFYDY